ncbi:hypothetical protein [Vibrio campbellii]|uniref:DUF3137 domain-containing protein n=1 Tax=Vibrio campbellii TaxID=680 RepID=A0ABY5IK59_9VIBR|nr:hypothetical protein [Vibrio campbellii]UTZ24654.1 hypothetical protein HB760_23410 [Vibrio campbellii]UTZ33209.1 hypothetical protein HB762_18045 [Vibrio campbellii]
MNHNKRVKANIEQIKANVEAATTEAQLIEIVESIKHHPGPLDYNDKLPRILMWLLLAFSSYGILVYYVYPQFTSSLVHLVFDVIESSVYWLPTISAPLLVTYLERQGKRVPLFRSISSPWLRMAAIAACPLLVANIFPQWHLAYWFVFEKLIQLISLDGQIKIPINLALLAGVIVPILWVWLRMRKHWRESVSDRIYHLDILHDNNLTQVKIIPEAKSKALEAQFKEFHRGNHRRTIDAFYEGQYQGKAHSFQFNLYHFHYVIKRRQTDTDANGKTTRTTVYDHYHRYGLLFDFPYVKSVALDADGVPAIKGNKYTDASNAFNQSYKVVCQRKMQAAKLLKPATVEKFLELKGAYRRLVFEVNANGKCCLAIDDDDLLTLRRQYGLASPTEFAEELAGRSELKKLNHLLEAVEQLMRLSDNNFR